MEEVDIAVKKGKTHPRSKASFVSQLFFCWQLSIFVKGFKKELNEDDLYDPLPEYDSKMLTDKLQKNWEEEVNFTKNPSLWRALFKTFGLEFMLYGLIYLPFECFYLYFKHLKLWKQYNNAFIFRIMQPFGLKKLLDYYTPNQIQITKQEALVYSALIVISTAFRIIVFSWHRVELTALAMKIRIACSSLIYRKSLTLKRSILQEITVGHIVNLLSSDVQKFDLTLVFVHFLWMGPLDAVLLIFYLYFELGSLTVISLGFSVPCLALLYYLSKKIASGRRKSALKTDYRTRFVNDIFCGIKTIKMYTWEKPFSKLMRLARTSELDQIKKVNFLRFHAISAKIFLSRLFVLPSLVATILSGVSLTSQYIFVLISCCEALKTALVMFALRGLIMLSELCISLERIRNFLLIDNGNYNNKQLLKKTKHKKEDVCILKSKKIQESPTGIYINNASVKWDSYLTKNILKNVKFEAQPGELVGVIGSVGSGKSTLLQTILNETVVTGTLVVGGLFSYAPQEPWIFSASVRQNIIFGQDMDRNRYRKVIQICALEQDFSIFPDGDRSLVGERGVKLSGGQKSRIGLARAVYRNADIYLLDDPLSAVDTEVGNQILNECILNFLKDKCVVLVTHQMKYLGSCTTIYIAEEGSIKLTEKNQDLNNVVSNINKIKKECADAIETISNSTLPAEEKEHRSKGLSYKAYRTYCQAGGNCLVAFGNLFLFFLIQFTCSFYDYFLTFWVNLEQNLVEINPKFENILTTMNCLYISIVLLLLSIILCILVSWSMVRYNKKASKNLHNNLLNGTLNATMKFFNNHSTGRILNRFSGDIGVIDETIPWMLGDAIFVFFHINGVFTLIAILNRWMLIPVVVVYLITFFLWKGFEPASKHIKKTERITKSPILTYLAASLEGLTTIRAFRCQNILKKEFDNHQNLHSSASYLCSCLYFALGFWCEFVSFIYMALTVFGFFLIEEKTNLGYVALGITQSIHLMGIHQYCVRIWADLDTLMTSVERVNEYSNLPPEKDDGTYTPPETCPNTGNITFQSVSMKYSEGGSLVLKKVSFHINSGAKIGIVGRTGAGKSSLISALFRLFNFEGKIFIDGVDTKTIPLKKLRSQISIIPQEPVLFLETLRKNLDPFDEFTDEELWNTLEKIELKGVVTGLDSVVSEGGVNFSVGQRQLLCLGRVMLRKNKIIILDEATANVDLGTDELIQKTIKRNFEGCTVLTIAHRINTVMDSDKVLVMKDGEVVEFDHPSILLQNENSLFYDYVNM